MSSSTSGGDSTGRFSADLEKLIARAGAKADRSGKSSKVVASAGEGGAVVGHAAGGELEGRGQEEDGGGKGVEGGGSSELSARAMKFRAMISKLRPQKKAILVKASIMYRSLSDWYRVKRGTWCLYRMCEMYDVLPRSVVCVFLSCAYRRALVPCTRTVCWYRVRGTSTV